MTSGKKGNTAWFIKEATAIHKGKYDYSMVDYRSCREPITIICPKHGAFHQKPYAHLQGHGCPFCGIDANRTGLFGVGVNDAISETKDPANKKWREMIRRCYDKKYFGEKSTYKGCFVCEEWLNYETFKKWFYDPKNGYRDGYQLDKDIILKGNKIYSPYTCCFVPGEINTLIINNRAARGKYPLGVSLSGRKFIARINITNNGVIERRKIGSFCTPEEAFLAYKTEKEKHIKKFATSYYRDGKITQQVFEALMRFEIEITD